MRQRPSTVRDRPETRPGTTRADAPGDHYAAFPADVAPELHEGRHD